MPARRPGPSVKDEDLYEALRRKGNSKEKSARIANAGAAQGRRPVAARGGRSGSYEDLSRHELYDRAKRIGIEGRSQMNKSQLIRALRNH